MPISPTPVAPATHILNVLRTLYPDMKTQYGKGMGFIDFVEQRVTETNKQGAAFLSFMAFRTMQFHENAESREFEYEAYTLFVRVEKASTDIRAVAMGIKQAFDVEDSSHFRDEDGRLRHVYCSGGEALQEFAYDIFSISFQIV